MATKRGRKRAPVRKTAAKKPAMDPMAMMEDLSPEDLIAMMHETMPQVMGDCFAKMDQEERASMISMCRSMLDRFEKEA